MTMEVVDPAQVQNVPSPDEYGSVCHRFFAPIHQLIPQPAKLNGVQQNVSLVPYFQMAYFKCLKERCAIYDRKRSQCGDKTKSDSLAELASLQAKDFELKRVTTVGGVTSNG